MKGSRAVEDGAPDAVSLKRQLLMRAGVAASLIVVLLGGLAVYERMTRVVPPPPVQAIPSPPPVTPEAAPGGGPVVATPTENPLADAILKRDAPPEPELASPPEIAPPGQRQADASEPRRGAPRLVLGGEEPAALPPPPVRQAAGAAAPAASAGAAPAGPAPTVAGKGYLVQLGVFGSPENAEALRARLVGLGMPARLESRVVVGPFPSQAAAREAQARLREAGQSPGLIVPPRR